MDMLLQIEEFEMNINPMYYITPDKLPCAKYLGDNLWEIPRGWALYGGRILIYLLQRIINKRRF